MTRSYYAIIIFMTEIILLLTGFVLAVAVGFLISTLIELRRTAKEAAEFLRNTGESLKSTLQETEETLKSLRGITDDINAVTRDARTFSQAITEVAENIKGMSETADELRSRVTKRASGIRAGIIAAVEVLVKNLLKRGGSR